MRKKTKVQPYVETTVRQEQIIKKPYVSEAPYVVVKPQVRRTSAPPLIATSIFVAPGLKKQTSKGKLQSAVTGLFENLSLKAKRRSSLPIVKTGNMAPRNVDSESDE